MTEKQAKKYFLNLMMSLILIGNGVILLFYILDPFQILHRSFLVPDRYIRNNSRYQNAGIINRISKEENCCDTLVIGTSHSQNFLVSDIRKFFQSNGVLQLSLDGGMPAEQKILYDRAATSTNIKKVIWDLHEDYADEYITPVNDAATLERDPDKYFPAYLYDDNPWNDYFYLASIDIIPNFIQQIFSGDTYATLQSWRKENSGAFGHGKELALKNPDVSLKKTPYYPNYYNFDNLQNILIATIKEHPEQQFYIFIPPYSRHFYAAMDEERFTRLLSMRTNLAQQISNYPNAKLFVFDDVFPSIDDLNRYRDLEHFDEDISREILRSMAAGEHTLQPSAIRNHLARMTKLVNRYTKNIQEK